MCWGILGGPVVICYAFCVANDHWASEDGVGEINILLLKIHSQTYLKQIIDLVKIWQNGSFKYNRGLFQGQRIWVWLNIMAKNVWFIKNNITDRPTGIQTLVAYSRRQVLPRILTNLHRLYMQLNMQPLNLCQLSSCYENKCKKG